MIKIQNVLVATDFSPGSDTALNYGREFARTFGGSLHVLHVVENPYLYAGPELVGIDIAAVQKDLEAGAYAALDRRVTEDDRRELHATTVVRTGNKPAYEIATYARHANIDVIIVGTHGRGVMGHLLMGSVAEKVVRVAPCPVLTVRHPEHEFILPDALSLAAISRL